MSSKYICDDCENEFDYDQLLEVRNLGGSHPLKFRDFCFKCFARHWKPADPRFSLVTPLEPV